MVETEVRVALSTLVSHAMSSTERSNEGSVCLAVVSILLILYVLLRRTLRVHGLVVLLRLYPAGYIYQMFQAIATSLNVRQPWCRLR